MSYVYLTIAFLSGAVLPIQIALNIIIGKNMGSALWASTLSFIVGLIGLIGVCLIGKTPYPNFQSISLIPPYAWFAGLLGAFYVTTTIIAAPKIGATLLIALVIAGQMMASLLIDHYGLFNMPENQITLYKIIGVLLIIFGVLMIKNY